MLTPEAVLEAVEPLFYGRGVQQVGMDQVRAASGASLKRLYQLFPSKDALVEAYLLRRDERWRRSVAQYADARPEPLLAVFDWLHDWFSEPDFRGCAFVNSFGELGASCPPVAETARAHKLAFREYLVGIAPTPELADHALLLAEGAITMAAVTGSAEPARQAKRALLALLGDGGEHGADAG
ncbi:helix-turn-helix domain-containing protein [Kutzneria viridogrisea]|uniref:HTH tetR-type domain-containing protein n=2 Tax=Kutzneria TaxID=43356 RepID=W5WC05_9PSEU|nr:TetR/AcrR family transcriptional regulator [Kutzneria albida]AHH98437.1 hypothetical protein KALB_5075 [Kutzneria albida DSM 43870]MBA8924043.1 AcrR family transcriptional regulator [Kutzneria viridogrisea]